MRNGVHRRKKLSAVKLGADAVKVLVFGAGVIGTAAAYYLNRAGHAFIDRIVDAPGSKFRLQSQGLADPRLDNRMAGR